MITLLLSFLLAIFPGQALADFTGPVIGVLDGDTIEVLNNNKAERIRLSGIDCPEKGQAFGNRAKQAASKLVFGKEVTLKTNGKDKYGRTIADVILLDGTNINHELVKDGWCWWYRKYAPGNVVLERLEKEARHAKKGLWKDADPVPPWVYRKARNAKVEQPNLVPLDTFPTTKCSIRGPPVLNPLEASPLPSALPIIGNRKSRIYHRPDCPSYNAVTPRNQVLFKSLAEAERAGYRRAKNCS